MKLAFMTSLCPDWDLETILDAMQRYGYEGLEPRVGWKNASGFHCDMTPQQRNAVRERFRDAGKSICCIATGCRFATADARELEGHIADAFKAIDLAADLGAPFVRTFGGPHSGAEMMTVVMHTAEAYKRVLDHAAAKEVTVTFETHDAWCSSILVREVVTRVNHPNLRVLWDVMHPQRVFEKPEETMAAIGQLTAHLHVHDAGFLPPDYKLTSCPLGAGVIDHKTPLRLLAAVGYTGYVSVEVIHKAGSDHDPDPVLKQYAEGLRQMIP